VGAVVEDAVTGGFRPPAVVVIGEVVTALTVSDPAESEPVRES
jgi:hypothetical protein